MTRYRAAVVAVLTVAALAVPSAAQAAQPAAAWEGMTRRVSPESVWRLSSNGGGVWLYGDSISVASYPGLVRTVHGQTGRQVAVDVNSGIPTRPAVDRLADRLAHRAPPRVLVMATGANDAVELRPVGDQVRRVRTLVGPTTRVVWVNASVLRQPRTRDPRNVDEAGTRVVNASIAANRASLNTLVDWDAFLSRRPGLREWYLRDGVHPNERGVAAWQALVHNATIKELNR